MYSKNLKSANLHHGFLKTSLDKEVNLGRIIGPFDSLPFSNLLINPIRLVPKKTGGWRLISNLSYPYGDSVNDFIDSNFCSVQYSKLDNVITMIQIIGQGAHLGKVDIQSAFNLCPEDFALLGIQFENEYWVQKKVAHGSINKLRYF